MKSLAVFKGFGDALVLMFHIARNPFAQPTARSVAESQVTQVHIVFGTQALNAGSSNFTVHSISSGHI